MAEKIIILKIDENLEIPVTITKKRIKNLNLRVSVKGKVSLSAPLYASYLDCENFLKNKKDWIKNALYKQNSKPQDVVVEVSAELAEKTLFPIVVEIYNQQFADILGENLPIIKYKNLKSMWGVCNIKKRSVTLNTQLVNYPKPAQEYIIMHELVHFIHPNHQKPFHDEMQKRMPDYKTRKKLLKNR